MPGPAIIPGPKDPPPPAAPSIGVAGRCWAAISAWTLSSMRRSVACASSSVSPALRAFVASSAPRRSASLARVRALRVARCRASTPAAAPSPPPCFPTVASCSAPERLLAPRAVLSHRCGAVLLPPAGVARLLSPRLCRVSALRPAGSPLGGLELLQARLCGSALAAAEGGDPLVALVLGPPGRNPRSACRGPPGGAAPAPRRT